jgi:hypothetical protein
VKIVAVLAALVLVPLISGRPSSGASGDDAVPASRPFYMGVTPWPHDFTREGINEAYTFIHDATDLNVHHFDDGIPWPEAFARTPYQPTVEANLRDRVARLRPDRKTYVSITPAREHGLVGYWGTDSNMPLPRVWKEKAIDDPDVIRAYLDFCRDLIRRFHPDYMAYGIEVNTIATTPSRWAQFTSLAKAVYTALRAENPGLHLFVTLQADAYWEDESRQRAAVTQILPYTDYIAVSAYPYVSGHSDPATLPRDFFARLRDLAPDKPFVIAETAFTARDVEAFGRRIPGREDWQNEYLAFVLQEAARLHAEFVVWFFYRDYDALWERIKFLGPSVELLKVFRNAGLLDGRGHDRPSTDTWRVWLRLPHRSTAW